MARAKFNVSTDEPTQVVDVTDDVQAAVSERASGICTVFVQHTTAGVVVQEAESRLLTDIEQAVSELVPDGGWRHDEVDDNADAHLRAMVLGSDVAVPVTDGDLELGTWQSILFIECDGPRQRSVTVVTTDG